MIERIRKEMKEKEINCIILKNRFNKEWAINKNITGYLFITQQKTSIIASNAHRHEIGEFDADFAASREEYQQLLKEKAEKITGETKTDTESEKLKELFDAEQTNIIQELRKIKTDKEIEKIKKACQITSKALKNCRKTLFNGKNEYEAINNIHNFYTENCVQDSFITNKSLTLVNANCLTAHAEPKKRTIQDKDLVIVDSGCRHQKYCSDITRTYSKNPSQKQKKLFNDLKDIQQTILNKVEAGKNINKLVELRDKMAEEKGYDTRQHILYSLGHGIGVQVHEKPGLNRSNDEEIQEGMVLTIEPGLHVPGIGGVRIEDTILVKENGCKILSKANKEM